MQIMKGFSALATYTRHNGRVYHAADTQHRGPSVSLRAFNRGSRLHTAQSPTPPTSPVRTVSGWGCPLCGTPLDMTLDANGDWPPCPNPDCQWNESAAPQPGLTYDPSSVRPPRGSPSTQQAVQHYAPPDTLGRVTQLKANQAVSGAVAETRPVAVQVVRPPKPQPRQTFPQRQQTLDAVVQYQVDHGQRAPVDRSLQAMVQLRCPRCGKPACTCPPAPPDTLGLVVAKRQADLARDRAAMRAAYPILEHWDRG